ncbi:MAG: ABC transporter permease, partial [Chloroflexi bacterium]|nr:ABC transporter permease [Chloroflexota bacterium]
MKKNIWVNVTFQVCALVLAFLISTLILVAVGAPPFKAYAAILKGAFGSTNNLENLLISWSPLLLTTAGVLITFSAGLWNIGVEGQMTLGAIFTTWILRLLQDSSLPPGLVIFLGILAGVIGGALWAGLAGALK